jgi:hypothetical protein
MVKVNKMGVEKKERLIPKLGALPFAIWTNFCFAFPFIFQVWREDILQLCSDKKSTTIHEHYKMCEGKFYREH